MCSRLRQFRPARVSRFAPNTMRRAGAVGPQRFPQQRVGTHAQATRTPCHLFAEQWPLLSQHRSIHPHIEGRKLGRLESDWPGPTPAQFDVLGRPGQATPAALERNPHTAKGKFQEKHSLQYSLHAAPAQYCWNAFAESLARAWCNGLAARNGIGIIT
jgi:hypothetical protein